MDFSELQGEWTAIPQWARFMITLGYGWPRGGLQTRRIALISMPCDSAAAGLIALGAMIRDLGDAQANDVDGHYEMLLQYARQFLGSCRPCDLNVCDPQTKGCGHAKKATGNLRSAAHPHGTYHISDRTDLPGRQIAFTRGGVTYKPNPQYATDWHIDGEPPPERAVAEGELPHALYEQMVEGAQIMADNLRRSYSGLCLAGRVTGESASREICASIHFRHETEVHGLESLLTVHGWSAWNISRVAFFNTRTEELDRNAALPRLVVADGDASFLKVVDQPEFHRSDALGVIHRTMDRDKLEGVGVKLLQLNQWYSADTDMLCELPPLPRGISVSILRRRNH